MLAFMKVSNKDEQTFCSHFNRGLSNLLGYDGVTAKTVVLPYDNEFGSSQEKIKRLV
jgi:hypothetical protein